MMTRNWRTHFQRHNLIAPLLMVPCLAVGGVCLDLDAHNSGVVTQWISSNNLDEEGKVLIEGSALFVGGLGVYVFDLSDPARPVKKGLVTGSAAVCQPQVVVGDYLIVTDQAVGLVSFDVTDPFAPDAVDTLPRHLDDVVHVGSVLYGAAGPTLSIIDVADPTGMRVTSEFTLPGPAASMVAGASRLYVVTGDSSCVLNVYDVGDPPSLSLRTSIPLGGRCVDLDIDGDRLFVPLLHANQLQIYDISTEAGPVLAGSYGSGAAGCKFVDVDGDSALVVTTSPDDGSGDLVAVINVSAPAAMILEGTLTNFRSPSRIACRDGFAYVKDGSSLTTIDHGRPLLGWLGQAQGDPGHHVVASGRYLVASRQNGFTIYDISDSAAPVATGRHDEGRTTGLAMAGSVVFQGVSSAGNGGGSVRSFDISRLTKRAPLGELDLVSDVHLLALDGDHLVVHGADNVIRFIDVSDASDMVVVGSVALPALRSFPMDMEVAWPHVYILNTRGELHVIDAGTSEVPVHVARLIGASGSHSGELCLADGLLLASSRYWIKVFDLTKPARPRYVGTEHGFAQPGINDLVAHDRIVYCMLTGENVAVRDFSDVHDVKQIGWFAVDGTARDKVLAVTNHGLAIAARNTLVMAPLQCTDTTRGLPVAVAPRRIHCSPNPFVAGTTLSFALVEAGEAVLDVLDLAGHRIDRIWSGWLDAGDHEFEWKGRSRGRGSSPGIYYFRLRTDDGDMTA